MIPAVSPAGRAYEAARRHSAVLDRSAHGRIVVSGADRASYLQGLLTNDIVALKAGQGCYAAYLTAQGRMIADVYVYELGDVILLTMNGGVKDDVPAGGRWGGFFAKPTRQWFREIVVMQRLARDGSADSKGEG